MNLNNMRYSQALEKILNGMSNDNATEIESGAQMLLALVSDVHLIGVERKLAERLTKCAADFATFATNCAYDEPCVQCIHPSCTNYGRQNR